MKQCLGATVVGTALPKLLWNPPELAASVTSHIVSSAIILPQGSSTWIQPMVQWACRQCPDLDLVNRVAGYSAAQVLMDIAGIAIVCGLGYLFLEMPAKWH